MAAATTQLQDLEGLLAEYASRPDGVVWVPLSMFTMQGEGVAISLAPARGGKVLVSDRGETLGKVRDSGFVVEAGTGIAKEIELLARRRAIEFDGGVLSSIVHPEDVPTAILHLAEVEIGVSSLLYVRHHAPTHTLFAAAAKRELRRLLKPELLARVKFGAQYTGKFKDGEFFCVAESDRPVGVKLVTNSENMRDAVIVGMMYEKEPIELVALRRPGIKLSGPRVVQFNTLYAARQFEKSDKLAAFLGQRAAG